MTETLEVGVVILNWNGRDDTLACLDSIYTQRRVPRVLVLVDNGSTDGSLEAVFDWVTGQPMMLGMALVSDEVVDGHGIRTYSRRAPSGDGTASLAGPRLVTIRTGQNLGFAGGNNVGLRYLLNLEPVNILLLNNDTVIVGDAMARLVEGLDVDGSIQAAIPQIRYFDDPGRIWNCGGSWTWYAVPRYVHAELPSRSLDGIGVFPVTFVTGCALLIRRDWLIVNGLLDERFFFGEEDVELSWRMRSSGGRMACIPSAVVLHKVGRSIAKATRSSIAPKIYCHYLNRLIFLRSVWGSGLRWHAWRLLILLRLAWVLVVNLRRSPRFTTRFLRDLASDGHSRDSVDSQYFAWIAREKFREIPDP